MVSRRLLASTLFTLALTAGPAGAQAPAGDPMTGRALFIGARPLAQGGSPCGACHAIGGESAPFAASLGPDLAGSFVGLDAAAVDGLLHDTPFPTMIPLYVTHPLTASECADLTAFLLQASGKPSPGGGRVAAYAAALAAALLALLGLAGRRRGGSARAELLARARAAGPPRRRRGGLPAPPPRQDDAPAAGQRVHGGAR